MSKKTVTDSDFYIIVGNKIKLARKEKGIDQESFAKCINLTRTSVINIEKGRQRPSIYQIWLMAQYLNVSITDLIPPLDLKVQIDDWTEKVKNNTLVSDENSEKQLIGFISATRLSK